MNEIDITKIIDMNYRVMTLLGIATVIIQDVPDKEKVEWFNKAVENVVYLNKPIPEMIK